MALSRFVYLLLAVTSVVAGPAQAVMSTMAAPVAVTCGPHDDQHAYSTELVQGAFSALVDNGNKDNKSKPRAGKRYYPRRYGNENGEPSDPQVVQALNLIPECHTGSNKFFEFPLTDPVFSGGLGKSQGMDRVIAISSVDQDGALGFTYCMAITHRGGTGQGDASFRPCL